MKRSILFLLFFVSITVFSQSISPYFPSAALGHSNNGNINLNWTAGEIVVGTLSGDGIILTQGFHQVNFLFVNIYEKDKELEVNVWPNPVRNSLNIKVALFDEVFNYDLISLQGTLIESGTFKSNKIIDVSDISSGMYMLKIYNHNRFLLIKIIKQ